METRANKIRWSVDQDGTWLHLLVDDGQSARRFAEAHKDKPLRVKLTRWSEKRSTSANAYAWTLLGKLSAVLGVPPEDIYRQLIPDVGGNSTAVSVPLDGLEMLRRSWARNGLGWTLEVIGVGDAPGMIDVMLYYGSSVYDSAQMSRLIELIIQEYRENGVEHLPPDKINAMLEAWNEKENKSPGDQPGSETTGL